MKKMMRNPSFTAILLAVTTVFTLFTGSVYAEEATTAYIDSTTLVVKDGKVISGDKSLVESGLIVIGDAEPTDTPLSTDAATNSSGVVDGDVDESAVSDPVGVTGESSNTQTSGKQPVKDNSALLDPDSSTSASNGVTLPTIEPKYVNPTSTVSTAGALRSSNSYTVTSSWGPSTYQLMVVHLSRYMNTANTTYTMDTAIIARGYAILDGKISTIGTYNANKFTGPIFHVNNGTLNVTNDGSVSHIYNNNSGNVTIEGLRVCYQNYSSNETTMAGYVSGAGRWSNNNAYPDNYISWDSPAQFVSPLVIVDGGTANIYDSGRVYMQNNVSNKNGSAIQANGGTVNLTNTTIRHCKTTGSGGAIYVSANGKAVLNSVTIDNCHATGNGGGIYVASGGQLTMNTVTISNCTANNGAAIYIAGSGTVTFNTVTLNNNTASASGGGIFVAGGTHSASATINNNKAQWGGGVYVAGGTFTYSGGTMQSNSATIDGGGICCYGGTAEVKGGTIRDNSAPQGGGLYVKGPGTIKMSAGTVTSNDNGSGVFLYDGANFELSGGEISANARGSHLGGGVAIYSNGNGVFQMTGGTISDHSGTDVHGIGLTGGSGTIRMSGGVIKNNSSSANGGGGICANCGTIEITGGEIGVSGAENYGTNGGGIYAVGTASLSISGTAKIKYNRCKTSGGGVFICDSGVSFSMTGGEVSNNTNDEGNGGGIWVGNLKSCSITGGTFYKNTVRIGNGGGIFFNRPVTNGISVSNILVEENTVNQSGGGLYFGNWGGTLTATITNVTVKKNKATATKTNTELFAGSGGGIAVRCEPVSGENAKGNVNLTVTGCTIIGNTANEFGGGVYVVSQSSSGYKPNVTINGNTKIGESADTANTANSGGGGIYAINYGGTNENVVFKIEGNVSIKHNVSALSGGGVFLNNITGAVINNAVIVKNKVNSTAANGGNGGGIGLFNATLSMNGTTVSGNVTGYHGGGLIANNSSLTTTNCVFGDSTNGGNTATVGSGGGIYATGTGTVSITGGNISYNTTSGGNGGGLCIENASEKATIDGTLFEHNSALFETPDLTKNDKDVYTHATVSSTGNGGAIFIEGVNTVVDLKTITVGGATETGYSNNAVSGGGIAVFKGANVTATGCTVTNNYALRTGGGYYLLGCGEGDQGVTTTLKTVNGTVSLNYGNGSTAYTGDSADKDEIVTALKGLGAEMGGGGLYCRGLSTYNNKIPTLIIEGTVFTQNKSYRGAAIYMHESVNMTVSNNAQFIKNQATYLGGVLCYIKSNCTADFDGCVFTENTAGLRGGAFYIQQNGVTLANSTFTKNSAVNFGGAILLKDTTAAGVNLPVTGCDFIENSANYGGAISTADENSNAYAFNITLTDCDFTKNHATANGGAILVGNKVTASMTGGYITENNAGVDQSGIEPIANNQNVATTAISGAGGGVAVFDGTFNYNLDATHKGAIHSNTAFVVGDDVFSNGSSSAKLSIPAVNIMDLDGVVFEGEGSPDWFEDYATGEQSGMTASISSSERFRFSNNSIRAYTNNINTQGKYVAITVGVSVNLGILTIVKSGEDVKDNQLYVFRIHGVAERNGEVIDLTVTIKGEGSISIYDMPVGNYTVTEYTSWAWRYGIDKILLNEAELGADAVNTGVGTIIVTPESIDNTIEFVSGLESNYWLDFNSAPFTNKAEPVSATVASVYSLPPKKNVIV